MRISDWSSDVCSSDLVGAVALREDGRGGQRQRGGEGMTEGTGQRRHGILLGNGAALDVRGRMVAHVSTNAGRAQGAMPHHGCSRRGQRPQYAHGQQRSEERSVGKEWVRKCRYRGGPINTKK